MTIVKPEVSFYPIQDIQFQGLHWIEASAGSGKTFTLSSLLVRILLEKYLPKQAVATTFTRAAAAELKQRIRARIVEMQSFFKERIGFDHQANIEHLQQLKAADEDPLKIVLLEKFSTQVAYACSRLQLVLEQLDELFVGTLDSFSQKLLREFAFESGKIERVEITDQSKQYTEQLIHDVLREWIQQQSQQDIDWLFAVGCLDPKEYFAVAENVLNFPNAQFTEVSHPKLQVEEYLQLREKLKAFDYTQLKRKYVEQGGFAEYQSGRYFKTITFNQLMEDIIPNAVFKILQSKEKGFLVLLPKSEKEYLISFVGSFTNKKTLKKNLPKENAEQFYTDPSLVVLVEVLTKLQEIGNILTRYKHYISYYIASQVKLRLPALLQQQGETTFAQQIKTLSEALQGEHGEHFAAFVQSSYPLILVDEFQDTNQEQDNMLASIWRAPTKYEKGCMIMVGDRKQAIYGFRGGDMLTFIRAYHDVLSKKGHFYRLKYNHRTIQPLVEAVDALFMQHP
ncbi:hypothetical protein P256_02601, partial [Acinetobacter nectaris CIP 110549]